MHEVNIYLLCLHSTLLRQLQYILKPLFEQFCLKMQNWISKKKKKATQILGRSEKGKQTFSFSGLIPFHLKLRILMNTI